MSNKEPVKVLLEVGNLMADNKMKLAEWLWHFPFESNSLWDRIIGSKFGPHSIEWPLSRVLGAIWNLWKAISKEFPSFAHLVHCVVGEGMGICF